jgi:ABC-type glycerol-3-phosphate transport system permease component
MSASWPAATASARPPRNRMTPRRRARLLGRHTLLVVLALLAMFPVILAVSTALKEPADVRVNPLGLFSSFST